MNLRLATFLVLSLASLGWVTVAQAGTATSVTGLYYTGVNNSGAALGDNATDSHWRVTYARVGGNEYTNYTGTYTGSAYVVDAGTIDGAWVDNSSTYRWITAPGAATGTNGANVNQGGSYLPGNGTSGNNSAYFVYRLQFTINGSGTTVNNNVQLSMTIAADDGYAVYVNPANSPTVSSTGVINAGGTNAVATGTGAWGNTTSFAIGNATTYGGVDNADFVIGTNTIYIVVSNTNSQTGYNNSTALNPSGLLVYQVGTGISIDGKPVPEVGAILPVLGALGLLLFRRFRSGAVATA